jgi:hypothetical protein
LVEFRYSFEDTQAGARGTLSIIFVGLGPAEIRHYAVAKILGDMSTKSADRFGSGVMVAGD